MIARTTCPETIVLSANSYRFGWQNRYAIIYLIRSVTLIPYGRNYTFIIAITQIPQGIWFEFAAGLWIGIIASTC